MQCRKREIIIEQEYSLKGTVCFVQPNFCLTEVPEDLTRKVQFVVSAKDGVKKKTLQSAVIALHYALEIRLKKCWSIILRTSYSKHKLSSNISR